MKERKPPIQLVALEALRRRLPNNHPKMVEISHDHRMASVPWSFI